MMLRNQPSCQTHYQLHPALGPVMQLFCLAVKHRRLLPLHGHELGHHSGLRLYWLARTRPHSLLFQHVSFPVAVSFTQLQLFSCTTRTQQRQQPWVLAHSFMQGRRDELMELQCVSASPAAVPKPHLATPPNWTTFKSLPACCSEKKTACPENKRTHSLLQKTQKGPLPCH